MIVIFIHIALMSVSTVTGGVLVEEGQKRGDTGRLTSLRSLMESLASLCAGPIGGWLAGVIFIVPAVICGSLAAAMAYVFGIAAMEDKVSVEHRSSAAATIVRSFRELLANRDVWLAASLFSFYHIAPGFQTPLFFHQTNALHFSPVFIGYLTLLGALGAIVGSIAYGWICRRVSFCRLFPAAILLGAGITLSYVYYLSNKSAMLIECGNGVIGTFAFVALLDFVARSIPKTHEALGYSLVFSLGNLAASVSDIIGSRWFDHGVGFADLVCVKACSIAVIALAFPFFPRRIEIAP